ncbi:MAG: lamin tail domain-containing protein [Planctomycetes bacterium]|nr:lamin tail domain-containing protein [Planctomycetota bacterium]
MLLASLLAAGLPSGRAADVDVAFNEVLYHPPAGLEDAEFIELSNGGPDPVDLTDWRIEGGIDFVFPGGASIAAGGYLIVVRSSSLAATLYPGVPRVGSYAGFLSNGGDRLRLVSDDGTLIDELEYSDDDGWPVEPDGQGASLEKLAPERDPWFADSWGPSLTLLGSPGALNTQFREAEDADLILAGEDWRYLKGTAEPSGGTDDWSDPSFDDAAWLTGPTGIGYGDNDDATVLADMQGSYSTAYMRRRFEVADPARVLSLALTVDYDDGLVAYLNGVEVARRNVPGTAGTPLAYNALAVTAREPGVPETIDLTGDRALLAAGTNVLAIQVLNQALSSTDLSMIPSLRARLETVGAELSLSRLAASSVVPRSATWSYFKGTAEPSATLGEWVAPAFDDAAWPSGPAGFGFGDNDDATVLGDMLNGYTTVYIRKRFTLAGAEDVAGMLLGVDFDDGCIAYLNGVEVARAFAPGSAGQFQPRTAVASGSHEAGTEQVFDLASRIGLLVEGENVLALQGFNSGIASSDFSLHPRLTVFVTVRGDPAAISATVSINEVHRPGGGAGFVELYNAGSSPVDISGYGLSDDPRDPLRHVVAAGTVLAAGAFLALAEADLSFALPAAGTLTLTDAAGVVLVDGKDFQIVDPALPAGSHPDGSPGFEVLSSATAGAPNAAPPDRGVVLNEIMYHPAVAGGAPEPEWIELHNRSGSAVSLAGWRFTRGIDYAFPAGATIPAGGYRVVANDPAAVQARYGITGVLGSYASGLRNDDEVIVLRDDLGNVADRVHYADDGRWPAEADGGGPSAELVNPALDNHTGQAWRASAGEGTPGAQNSAHATSAQPLVTRLKHFPPVPRAGQSVLVTAEVEGLSPIVEVRLFHRAAGDPSFTQVDMLDDGLSGDGAAGDALYGATLPSRAAGTVVEFFVEAEDADGQVRLVPPEAPGMCNLYLVDDPPADLGVPAYRIVMTPADRTTLQTRDVYSNDLLNGTFIAGNSVIYRVGIRYRGESSRLVTPKSYRVQLTDDEELEGIKNLNLNGNRAQHQHVGMQFFRGADVPASLTRPVRLLFGTDAEVTYTRMEEVDEQFLRRYYSSPQGEDGGNLYRGIDNGNLDYRGTSPGSYRPNYKKETNEEADDWSDLIRLCDVLTNTPDADLPAVLPGIIDVEEWVRFFAVHTLISTQEGGIYRDRGDDYFLYRRPSNGLWVLVPWDIDDSFSNPTERLFRPTLFQIRRILQHPEWTASYYAELARLSTTHFSQARMQERFGLLTGLFPPATLSADLAFVGSRRGFVDSQVNQDFTVSLSGETFVSRGATWRFFRGRSEPSGGTLDWAEPGFDDSSWESGPTGIGYGDGDDATVLADMQGGYTTVYARHAFAVADPAGISALELSMDYDDGFVAFLNGVEVARANAGAAGTYPAFDGLATASREAGSVQVFDVAGAGSILVPGTNVLAVVGLNQTIDSTDFSLVPEIRTGGVVGQGCPGDTYVTGSQMLLSGLAPVTQTRTVRVNGADAAFDRFTGAWSRPVSIGPGTQNVTVQALDRALRVVASQSLKLSRVHTFGGAVSGAVTLLAADSPFLVTSSVSVPAGARLTIEPGCSFLVGPGRNFTIQGEIKALGTAAAKIVFGPVPCQANWGFFTFQTNAANELNHCELSRSTATPGCLTVQGSTLDIESCHIHDITGEGVSASSSTINIRNTTVERTNEALSLDFCRTIVELNTLRNVIGKSDLCDANGSNNPPARIAFNTFYGTSDDAIDADRGSVSAEGNSIRSCGDQGISLVGAGNSTVYRNVVFRNGIGLSAKDSHRVVVDFNTFAYNSSIGVRAIEKTGGLGGGTITLKNSIVWGSPTPLFVNSTGTIATTYSDIQGGAPPGAGNISLDPLFASASANDFHLRAGSPCIGAAEGGDDMGALPFEIAPRAPTDLAVTGTTATSISLGWKDNSTVEASYEVHRRISSGFTPEYLVARGDVWRYFKGRSEPSGGTLDWTAAGFDDAGWSSGATSIGYGDGDDATVLTDMQNAYSTVYLRTAFEVADASAVTVLEFLMDFDDGFVAFLNGVEIARQNAGAAGTYPAFDAVASADHEAGTPYLLEVPVSGILVTGTNLLAVQGLNVLASSTDLTVAPELRTVDETPFGLLATLPPNARDYTDTAISSSGKYSYKVRAVNASGPSGFSNVVTVQAGTLPAPPSGLTVTSFDDSSIGLAWSDNSSNETTFELERAVGSGEPSLLVSLPEGTTSYLDLAVTSGESYSFRVRATNAFGSSAYSNTVTQRAGTPPAAPSDLRVVAVTLTTIELAWTDNATNETTFELEVKVAGGAFQPWAVLGADVTSHLDLDLESGQAYTYRVRAVNAVGPSGYSNEVTGTTGRLPDAPADLTVSQVGLDFVMLGWVDSSPDETGFELERRGALEADFTLLVALEAGRTTYADAGLEQGSSFVYRLRAVNAFGVSAYSNEAAATTGRLPAAPSGLHIASVGLTAIGLAWTDAADNETGFELERSDAGAPFAKTADLPADSLSHLDSGLVPGTAYAYRLRAVNAFGGSPYSEETAAATGKLPAAPSGLTVESIGVESLSFTWSDESDDETGFLVERSDAGGPFALVAQVGQDVTRFGDAGLLPGTLYAYRVRAVNRFGSSEPSEVLEVTTGRFPAAPRDLAAAARGPFAIDVSWTDASDNETGFELERRSGEGGAFLKIADLPADATAFGDADVRPGREYFYRVRSVNGFGASEYAGPASAVTEQADPGVASVAPSEGPAAGGTPVAILGSYFLPGTAVTVGGQPLADLSIVDLTRIEGRTPPGAKGAADVVVATSEGTVVLPEAFRYFTVHLRGDANSDVEVDISDVLYLLDHLFLAGPAPPCDEVADANSDAGVDLSDAIYILRWLFSGGDPLVPEEARCY